MQIRHVIWDWNGTLVNDASLCVEIVNDLLKEYSLNQVDLNYYRNNFKFPVSAYYKKLGLPYEGIEYEKIARKFISQYRELSHKCNLQPFARKTINRIFNLEINQSLNIKNIRNKKKIVIRCIKIEKVYEFNLINKKGTGRNINDDL